MKQAALKKPERNHYSFLAVRGIRESVLLIFVALGVYFMVALLTYDPGDPGWLHTGNNRLSNLGGKVGAFFAELLFFLFGYLAYLAPLMDI